MRSSLVVAAALALLAACSPMYVGGPPPVAVLHQRHDIAYSANIGLNGLSGGGAYAITDEWALRVSGGYRPFNQVQNGYGTLGLSYYSSPARGPDPTGQNLRGLRMAGSLDLGGGGGQGASPGVNISTSGLGTSTNRFAGNYLMGQLQGDVGYEWPNALVLGSLRATYFDFLPSGGGRAVDAAFLEPTFCLRVGPRSVRWELRMGLIIPVDGQVGNFGGVQPFLISTGLSGTIGTAPKRARPLPPLPVDAPPPVEAPPPPVDAPPPVETLPPAEMTPPAQDVPMQL